MATIEPMVPFLAGWIAGAILRDGRSCMKVVSVEPRPPDSCWVRLESGLLLLVKITEADGAENQKDQR